MQKDIEAGMRIREALKKQTLSYNTWIKFKDMKAGKDYDPNVIETTAKQMPPEISTHNLDPFPGVPGLAWGQRGYSKKQKARSQKCVVVLTETSNLRDVIEGLL